MFSLDLARLIGNMNHHDCLSKGGKYTRKGLSRVEGCKEVAGLDFVYSPCEKWYSLLECGYNGRGRDELH